MKKFQIDEDDLIDIIDICKAFISITDFETCYFNHKEEIKKARLFVKSYEHFEKETKDND